MTWGSSLYLEFNHRLCWTRGCLTLTISSEVTPAMDFNMAPDRRMDDLYNRHFCRHSALVVLLLWFPVALGITDKATIGSVDLEEQHGVYCQVYIIGIISDTQGRRNNAQKSLLQWQDRSLTSLTHLVAVEILYIKWMREGYTHMQQGYQKTFLGKQGSQTSIWSPGASQNMYLNMTVGMSMDPGIDEILKQQHQS